MDTIRILFFVFVAVLASACTCFGDMLTDDEIRRGIVRFLTPRCGGNVDDNDPPDPELADFVAINGDTNRLARILAEIAQTNNAWYSEMAMWELEKYGTTAQLPFLYSCATNPIIGDRAVRSVLNIEGVTSNSIDIAQRYLMSTNVFPRAKQHDRSLICEELLTRVFESADLSPLRPLCLSNALEFAQNANTMHISLNDAIFAVDPTYQYSKRRLAVMRAAQNRCVNQGLYNYVTNAINELVAYPEANLPD